MHCLTVSLAGTGLGTVFGEQKAIGLLTDADFTGITVAKPPTIGGTRCRPRQQQAGVTGRAAGYGRRGLTAMTVRARRDRRARRHLSCSGSRSSASVSMNSFTNIGCMISSRADSCISRRGPVLTSPGFGPFVTAAEPGTRCTGVSYLNFTPEADHVRDGYDSGEGSSVT
jgi:hypothetical protein